MKRYLYLIVAVFMATVLAACHDDEPEIQTPDDEVTRIEFPTDDVIKATYAGNYAVIGSDNYDESTRYVIKRLSGARYSYSPADDFIADDVRLVFLNNEALLSLEKPMVMQLKKVVENGGYIYVHKPNSFAMVFLAIAIYDDIDEALAELKHGMPQSRSRADADNSIEYDSYVMGPQNRQLCLLDIYDGQPKSIDVFDSETGEITSEVYQPEIPSAYAYGRFAENIIEWLNEDIPQSRGLIFTRAGEDVLDNASDMKFVIPCHIHDEHLKNDFDFDASLRVWISDLYNFDKDEDYYHIVLEEAFDGSNCYAGQYYSKKTDKILGYKHKYAGFPYSSLLVKPSFKNESGGNGTLKDAWNPQPENTGVTSSVEQISGWSFNTQVGCSGGFAALFSSEYRNEQKVTNLDKSISTRLRNGDKKDFYWDFELTNELYYKRQKGDLFGFENGVLHEPSKNSLQINTCRTRQSWNWLVSGTKERRTKPFTLFLELKFRVMEARSWKGQNETSQTVTNWSKLNIDLPIPNRFRKTYSISCENAVLSEWSALKEEIISHDRENFSKLNATRCAPTDELVDKRTAELWNKTIQGVAARISTFNHLEKDRYVIVLKNDNGKVIGKKLIVTAQGAQVE